ncbi:MAG: DUF308 domain-containing protein [Prevotella sp.]|jgi:uncharacterized membrane protein HdeD (DUF308 family)|nr:DUF308 domain-containing protein [Prevotella sp.]
MKIFQSSIFRAVCAIVIGVLLVKFPQEGVTWLTIAIGALFLLSGIIALIAYWQAKRHAGEYTITDKDGRVVRGGQPTFPIVGAGSVILGLVLTLTPNAFINGLMYMLAVVLILGGVTQLMALVAARRLGSVPFGYWIMPSLILLTGLFVILKPMESAELPLLILGWCSILYGVVELINALKIHRLRKEADDALAIQQETQAEEIESHIGNDALDVSSEDVDTGLVVPTRRDD